MLSLEHVPFHPSLHSHPNTPPPDPHPAQIVNFHLSPLKALQSNREWFIASRKPGRAGLVDPPIDARNILRPETVESLFVAYRVTGDPVYREWVRRAPALPLRLPRRPR